MSISPDMMMAIDGAVHQRMARRHAARRRVIADDLHHQVGRQLRLLAGLERRNFDDAHHGARQGAAWRQHFRRLSGNWTW
jgi:hypothetical protein